MIKKALCTIEEYAMIKPFCNIIVAISGGADSMALLHFLCSIKNKYDLTIVAVHINHNLRGKESEDDAKFCKEFCENNDIPVIIENINIPQAATGYTSIEEKARKLRYALLNNLLLHKNFDKIALGHNKNDVAETSLMQIFRGSAHALGIPYINKNIIRPLLNVSREEIIAYCMKNKLLFRQDSSNNQNYYNRNKIRNILLPFIKEHFNPKAVDAIVRLSDISYKEDIYLNSIAKDFYGEVVEKNGDSYHIDIDKLSRLDYIMAIRILKLTLTDVYGVFYNLISEHMLMVLELKDRQSGKTVSLPKGIVAVRSFNKIIISNEIDVPQRTFYSYILQPEQELFIPEANKWFFLTKMPKQDVKTISFNHNLKNKDIVVRTRKTGDTIYFNNIGTKSIKKYFIEQKIPKDERNIIPLLATGQDIIYISKLDIVGGSYKPKDNFNIYLQIWESIK